MIRKNRPARRKECFVCSDSMYLECNTLGWLLISNSKWEDVQSWVDADQLKHGIAWAND